MDIFVNELIRITGLSREYAEAAYYTISVHRLAESPIKAANTYADRFGLRVKG